MSPARLGNATQFKGKSTVAEPTSAIRSDILKMKLRLKEQIPEFASLSKSERKLILVIGVMGSGFNN